MTQEPQASQRVVIDTSVLLPILLYHDPESNWLAKLWIDAQILPLSNRETISELWEKLVEKSPRAKPQQARLFAETRIRKYEPWCEPVALEINPANPRCSDTEDQKFIDLAITGHAATLVTRDRALLCMNDQVTFEIINDRDFRGQVEGSTHHRSTSPRTGSGF
jgi:putative PIN family toxin of toxin-antitoxin system